MESLYRFSDVFRGYRKRPLTWNRLEKVYSNFQSRNQLEEIPETIFCCYSLSWCNANVRYLEDSKSELKKRKRKKQVLQRKIFLYIFFQKGALSLLIYRSLKNS